MKRIPCFFALIAFCIISCKSVQNQSLSGDVSKPIPCYTDARGKYILIKDMNSGKSWKLTYKQWTELSKMIKE